jgi:hypothetical protein
MSKFTNTSKKLFEGKYYYYYSESSLNQNVFVLSFTWYSQIIVAGYQTKFNNKGTLWSRNMTSPTTEALCRTNEIHKSFKIHCTTVIIRSFKSKRDRKYNDQKKKHKRTNNDLCMDV